MTYKQCQHTGNLIVNDTRPMPALRVLIGHWNFRLCQGLCRIIADPTISTMYPTIKTQSHSSFVNPTFPFSISLFPFWIPLSVYNPTIKISIPLFQVIPLPLFLYIPCRLKCSSWMKIRHGFSNGPSHWHSGTGSGFFELPFKLKAMGLGAHVEYALGAKKLKIDEN